MIALNEQKLHSKGSISNDPSSLEVGCCNEPLKLSGLLGFVCGRAARLITLGGFLELAFIAKILRLAMRNFHT